MRLLRSALPLLLLAGLLAAAPPARAQDVRGDKLLRLLQARPRGMSIDTWREQRREAARELGRLKERRAVPALLRIIAKERFDVILEIAIDALGDIGDRRAIGALQRLLHDPSLDAYVRDAAASALRKLERGGRTGGDNRPSVTTPPPPRPVPPKGRPAPPPGQDSPDAQQDPFGALPRLELGKLPPDLIARSVVLDIMLGAGELTWDGGAQQTSAALAVASRYRQQVERKRLGYVIDGLADLSFALVDPPLADAQWSLGHRLRVDPEVRFYPFTRDLPLLFGQVSGGIGYGMELAHPPLGADRRFALGASVAVGAGPGYGRIYDIGPRLRLHRIARVLRQSRLLTGKLDSAAAERLIQIWFALRNEIGSFQRLGHTLRALREAKLLESEQVDPATSYRLIRILDDPQLDQRHAGIMLRVGYGYARTLLKDAEDQTQAFAYLTGEYARQIGTARAARASLRFYYNTWGEPDTFAASLSGGYSWYLYNRAFDPLGAIEVDLSAGLSKQPGVAFDDGGVGYSVVGSLRYARFFSRSSSVLFGVQGGTDTTGPLLMLTLEARYGVARGTFASAR